MPRCSTFDLGLYTQVLYAQKIRHTKDAATARPLPQKFGKTTAMLRAH